VQRIYEYIRCYESLLMANSAVCDFGSATNWDTAESTNARLLRMSRCTLWNRA